MKGLNDSYISLLFIQDSSHSDLLLISMRNSFPCLTSQFNQIPDPYVILNYFVN